MRRKEAASRSTVELTGREQPAIVGMDDAVRKQRNSRPEPHGRDNKQPPVITTASLLVRLGEKQGSAWKEMRLMVLMTEQLTDRNQGCHDSRRREDMRRLGRGQQGAVAEIAIK